MDYIISGKDGVTKGQVAGIAHQEYVDETPTYEPNYATKYKDLITDPHTGEFIAGVQSKAQLIGLIVGSFGAGAAFVNAIRDYSVLRNRDK